MTPAADMDKDQQFARSPHTGITLGITSKGGCWLGESAVREVRN